MWFLAEGAGIIALIAYVLTGVLLAPAVIVLAIIVLVWFRPSQIEETGAA